MESSKAEENVKIVKQSVLESFSDLADVTEKKRIDSALTLLKHLLAKSFENKDECIPKEVEYACSRLVRGLGSSRDTARKGYFAALVAFLSHLPSYTMANFLQVLDKELEMGKFSSKGEEGEVCFGRILAFGALIRSGHFSRAPIKEQQHIITQMIELSNKKSYLPQLSTTFLVDLIDTSNELLYSKVLWPALQPWLLKPWSEQTVDSFHLLLKIAKTFPAACKKSELKNLLGAPKLIRMDSIADVSNILLNFKGTWQQHPVYEAACMEFGASPDLAIEFWHSHVDSQLLGPKSSRSKGSLAIEIFRLLVTHLQNKDKISQLLTHRLISILRQRLVRLPPSDEVAEDLRLEANAALDTLIDVLKSSETTDSTRAICLERIVTSSRGEFGFDQLTRSNVVHSIALSLKSDGLFRVGDLCRAVISGESHPSKGEDDESNDSLPSSWLNKDRIAAINLLSTLTTHPMAQSEFRAHQILLLAEYAFFPPPGCTSLCSATKEGLLRCLGASSPHHTAQPLVVMREQLTEVVNFINKKITSGHKPHKVSKEVIDAWKKMMVVIGKLKTIVTTNTSKDSKASSEKHLASVLLILFMQLGIQLFLDPELAMDSLEELHVCVEKAGLTKQKVSSRYEENEPNWVDVVTDLFLSLLSQNSSMLRGIVSRVFNALCPLMTEDALSSLVSVLDCSSDQNPLSHRSEQEEESEVPESDDEGGSSEEQDKTSSGDDDDAAADDDDMEDEDDMPEEDTVSDKVRAAVREALGNSAELTDTESIDVDDISEEEGNRLDNALSQAFSALKRVSGGGGQKGTLTKKQLRDHKELVHFRVRVLDLIEIYLQSEQSMHLTLGLILPLFSCLEACLKDVNQKPLEARLRSALRKLSAVKKFVSTEKVDIDVIVNLLKMLIEKGDRTAAVFLDVNAEVCTVSSFLVRCSHLLPIPDKNQLVANTYISALKNFFERRDCLLPPTFFSSVLKTNWPGNFILWPYLVSAAFENTSVRPFRRTQALTLLREIAANERLFSQQVAEKKKLSLQLGKHAVEVLSNESGEDSALKQRFLKELLLLLIVVCQHSKSEVSWVELKEALVQYLCCAQSQPISREVKKVLRRLQGVLEITDDAIKISDFQFVQPKPVVNNKSNIVNGNNRNKKRKAVVKVSKSVGYSQEKKVKKQAKELRLSSLSSGLDVNMSFSNLQSEDVM